MTETSTPRDAAQDALAMTAATMVHDLVAAQLAALRAMPDHWARLAQDRQQRIIEDLKVNMRALAEKSARLILSGNIQAVPARLEFVNRKDGIKAGLTVKQDALHRHALFDASGAEVLVVIVDPTRWAERLDEIKAKVDQLELFDPATNYDAARDQPGYRRDQDPFAPAGEAWEALKKSIGSSAGDTPAPQGSAPAVETSSTPAAEPVPFEPLLPGGVPRCQDPIDGSVVQCGLTRGHGGAHSAAIGEPDDEALKVDQRLLQEKLQEAGLVLSLGAIQARTPEEFEAARIWVEAYISAPDGCEVVKPEWLPPIPTATDSEDDDAS